MNRRSLTGPLVKSGLFIIATVLATALLAVSIAQTDSGDKDTYVARFTDVSGLRVADSVRIAGVQIGRVEKIAIVDRRTAEVSFTVEKGRRLPASATAKILYLNLVGQRYMELGQGTGEAGGALKVGATIPVERTKPALDLTVLFNGFQPLFQSLDPQQVNQLANSMIQVLQGEGGTLETLLSTVGSLTTTLAGKDAVIGQVIDNLVVVLDTVNKRGNAFGDLVGTLNQLVSGLAADRKPIGQAVEALDDLAVTTAGFLKDSRAPLKKDIAELGRLSKNLADNRSDVDRFLKLLPTKLNGIARMGSYGSWLNFYVCEATVTGASYKKYPNEVVPPIKGIPNTAARCK